MFDKLSAPIKVSFDITHGCNLRCRHCRLEEPVSGAEELTSEEVKSLIDELSMMQIFILGLSGGEPFTREDFAELSAYACESDIAKIFISTNCTVINEGILKRLAGYRNKITFKVSIDGVGETHDTIRNREGVFDETVRGIRLLAEKGFSVHVTTTLMQCNFREVFEIVEFVKKSGAEEHRLIEVMPVGKAGEEAALSEEIRESIRSRIMSAAQSRAGRNYKLIVDIPFSEDNYGSFTCQAGRSECGILPDGTVVGCRLLPAISSGNVRDRGFMEIWNDSSAFKAFREFTAEKVKGNCSGCEYGALCRGGCRAYALAVHKDFYMPDPRCALAC